MDGATTPAQLTEDHIKLLYLISVYTGPKIVKGSAEGEVATGKGKWIRKIPLLVLIYEGLFLSLSCRVQF